jgi:hypothetical protein
MGGGLAMIRLGDYKGRMKTVTRAKPKTKAKRVAHAAPAPVPDQKGKSRKKLDASGLAWLWDQELPPADQLPENPVLYLRRL